MKIKDNFWLGLLAGASLFGLFFLLMNLIPWSQTNQRAPFLLSFIPGLILMRILLVNIKYDKMGRGVLVISCIGMLLVFFLV
jgi:hypothetical protein